MISKRAIAGATFAALLAASPALAPTAALAQTAGAPVDPERLALSEKIYAMLGGQTLLALTRALKGSLALSLQAQAGKDPARAQAIQAALDDGIDGMMPKILQGGARIMAQDFSIEELRAMLAFYQSPTGQDVIAKMPLVTQQAMQMSVGLLPSFMRQFEADYCRRVTCSAQEQQAFAQINARFDQNAASAASHQ